MSKIVAADLVVKKQQEIIVQGLIRGKIEDLYAVEKLFNDYSPRHRMHIAQLMLAAEHPHADLVARFLTI